MKYLIHYPRGLANEYTIYAGDKATLESLEVILAQEAIRDARDESYSVRWIARKEAIMRGITHPARATQYREQWYGAFAETGQNFDMTAAGIIADAAKATTARLAEAESMNARYGSTPRRPSGRMVSLEG